MSSSTAIRVFVSVAMLMAMPFGTAEGQPGRDVITVGSVASVSPGQLVMVPIFVRDVAGSPLGGDQPVGRAIQDFAITVQILPAGAVSMVSFQRSGLTANLTPVFETSVESGDRQSWIASFDETDDPVLLTLDATEPGERVVHLVVQIDPSFVPGSAVRLRPVAATTALGNQQGTVVETQANGRLELVDGLLGPAEIFIDGFESGDLTAW